MWRSLIVLALVSSVVCRAQADDTPDFAAMDKPVLVILATNQQKQIAMLEARVADLERQLAEAKAGGAITAGATVSGEMVVIETGAWIVKIESVQQPDASGLQQRVDAERLRLPELQAAIQTANAAVQKVMARRPYDKDANRLGYRTSELRSAQTQASAAERALQMQQNKIAMLERQIEQASQQVLVTGRLEDGRIVRLEATPATTLQMQGWSAGERKRITGRGEIREHEARITVHSAVPAMDVPQPATEAGRSQWQY